ncbi:MAG: hypothetical protein ACTSRP_17895 [Candidatus Helarchaeota archaeon]
MGNLGIYFSRYKTNSDTLKKFDIAIQQIKKNIKDFPKETIIKDILDVIEPISERIDGHFTTSTLLDDEGIINILKEKFHENWFQFIEKIHYLRKKLTLKDLNFTEDDFEVLENIADAIDIECENLFQKMREP